MSIKISQNNRSISTETAPVYGEKGQSSATTQHDPIEENGHPSPMQAYQDAVQKRNKIPQVMARFQALVLEISENLRKLSQDAHKNSDENLLRQEKKSMQRTLEETSHGRKLGTIFDPVIKFVTENAALLKMAASFTQALANRFGAGISAAGVGLRNAQNFENTLSAALKSANGFSALHRASGDATINRRDRQTQLAGTQQGTQHTNAESSRQDAERILEKLQQAIREYNEAIAAVSSST